MDKLTITNDSHIFRVVTVVLEYLVMGAAQEVVLSASTHHIVQNDGTRTRAKCTVNATNRRAWIKTPEDIISVRYYNANIILMVTQRNLKVLLLVYILMRILLGHTSLINGIIHSTDQFHCRQWLQHSH